MSEAVLAVRDGNSVRGMAIRYGIPRSTLKHYCTLPDLNIRPRLGSTRPVFSDQQEKQLVEYLLELDKWFYGMNCTEIRCFCSNLLNGITSNIRSIEICKGWIRLATRFSR